MSSLRRILTISCNDQGISWGPAVHYLELWNAFKENFRDKYRVLGLVPSWTGKPFIIRPRFDIHRIAVANLPRVRQAMFDLAAALAIAFKPRYFIYLRLSSYHLLTIACLGGLRRKFCVELNGIADSDARSARAKGWKRRLAAWQERWLVRRAATVFAVSSSIAAHARAIGGRSVRVVRNGVSPQFFDSPQRGSASGAKTVIYVGTYTSWDGCRLIPNLAKNFPDVRFLMVGDGPFKAEIVRSSPSNVDFAGIVAYGRLGEYYHRADAGIVLYEHLRHQTVELSSIKILEYMACGLPIFTTQVPGLEFIKENGLGVLADFATVQRDFCHFLMDLDVYKKNVERFRRNEGSKFGWPLAAKIVEQSIRLHS